MPVCGESIVRPVVWIAAVEAERIPIMTIDVNGTESSAIRRVVAVRSSIVRDKWYDNTGVPELILDIPRQERQSRCEHVFVLGIILEVFIVGEASMYSRFCSRVLILWLDKDNRSTIRDLSIGYNLTNTLSISGSGQSGTMKTLSRHTDW